MINCKKAGFYIEIALVCLFELSIQEVLISDKFSVMSQYFVQSFCCKKKKRKKRNKTPEQQMLVWNSGQEKGSFPLKKELVSTA